MEGGGGERWQWGGAEWFNLLILLWFFYLLTDKCNGPSSNGISHSSNTHTHTMAERLFCIWMTSCSKLHTRFFYMSWWLQRETQVTWLLAPGSALAEQHPCLREGHQAVWVDRFWSSASRWNQSIEMISPGLIGLMFLQVESVLVRWFFWKLKLLLDLLTAELWTFYFLCLWKRCWTVAGQDGMSCYFTHEVVLHLFPPRGQRWRLGVGP